MLCRGMTNEEDLGFPVDHAHIATDQLSQPIQDCLNDYDLSVVLTAITQVFYGTLYDAGLDEKHVMTWTKNIMKLAGKPSKQSVRGAVMKISDPINDLVVNSNINPLAVAFSLATAMTSIVRMLPIVSDAMDDKFMAALIGHINEVRSQ